MTIADSWRVTLLSDTDEDDSDKSFTVPEDLEYQILWVWVELTTSSDAGNRQLVLECLDDTDETPDVIGQPARAGAVQAAETTRYYLFAPGVADLTDFRDTDFLSTPMAQVFLQQGYSLRVYDNNAVAAAADDMIVHVQVSERGV